MALPQKKQAKNIFLHLSILVLLLLSSLPSPCHSRKISGQAKLSGVLTEHTVVKFALSPGGKAKIHGTFRTNDVYQDTRRLKLYHYVDEDWDSVKKATTCVKKAGKARLRDRIYFNRDGEGWVSVLDTDIDQTRAKRPRYWYLTIADCSLEEYFHDDEAPEIRYELTIYDDIGTQYGIPDKFTHLPNDEQMMTGLHKSNALLSFLLVVVMFLRAKSIQRKRGEVHVAGLIVAIACLAHSLSSCCEVLHLNRYEFDGIGSYFMDALSAHFEAFGDSLICLILLSVAAGWTLPSDISIVSSLSVAKPLLQKVDGLRCPNTRNSYSHPTFVVGIILVSIHAILAQWGRTYDDDFDCYHDLEHLPGKILFFFRLTFGVLFMVLTAALRRNSSCSYALKVFFFKFTMVGLSWFIFLPSLGLFTSSAIPAYRRHEVVSGGAAIVQLTSLVSLAWMFLGGMEASAFHKVSRVGGARDGLGGGARDGLGGGARDGLGGGAVNTFMFGKTKVRLD